MLYNPGLRSTSGKFGNPAICGGDFKFVSVVRGREMVATSPHSRSGRIKYD